MRAFKTIMVVGIILSASALGVRGAEVSASFSLNEQIRAAIALFQDQKAEFLKKRREDQKSATDIARDEIRDQIAASKPTIKPLVQELRQSIEEAKRQSKEQNRKLVLEATEAARTRR